MRPELSVVIPTYRRAQSLGRLLTALSSQSLPDLEITVVDQNPPGFLAGALPAGTFAGVKVIRLEQPNASTARNVGFSRSRGRYVLFLDDDVVPDVSFCAAGLEVLKVHPQVQCLWPVVYSSGGIEEALAQFDRYATGMRIPNTSLYELTEARSDVVFFEREYFARSGGFDEVLFGYARTAEDQELYLRMRASGMRIWGDRALSVFHDDMVAGGCGLRTGSYWETRERCVKAWTFRHRCHARRGGRLSGRDVYRLMRSAFLNRTLVTRPPGHTLWHAATLLRAIRESREFFVRNQQQYPEAGAVNHLRKYVSVGEGAVSDELRRQRV